MKKLLLIPILFISAMTSAQVDTLLSIKNGHPGKAIFDTAVTIDGNYLLTPSPAHLLFDSSLVVTDITLNSGGDSLYKWKGEIIATRLKISTIGGIYAGTGTAFTSYTTGDLIYASATNTLSKLAATTNGYVLTLVSGVPTWAAASGGGTPAGSTGQIQFNSSGSFGANSNLFWDNTTHRLGLFNSSPTNSFTLGITTNSFSTALASFGSDFNGESSIMVSNSTSSTAALAAVRVFGANTKSSIIGEISDAFTGWAAEYKGSFLFDANNVGGAFLPHNIVFSATDPTASVKYYLGGRTSSNLREQLFSTGNLGLSSTGTMADVASAILHLTSTTKGFLPPRMTSAQASAISSPAQALMLFVTDTNATFTSIGWWGWDGTNWDKLNN